MLLSRQCFSDATVPCSVSLMLLSEVLYVSLMLLCQWGSMYTSPHSLCVPVQPITGWSSMCTSFQSLCVQVQQIPGWNSMCTLPNACVLCVQVQHIPGWGNKCTSPNACVLCVQVQHIPGWCSIYVTQRMCTLCTGTTHPRVGQHVYGPPQPPTAVVRVGFAVRRHDHLRPFRRHHRLQPAHHQETTQA